MTDLQQTVRRLFTATLILGVSGSGKTSLLATYADYLWEVYRKILLLYSWDGGAIPTDAQRRMKQGLIRFWRARTRSANGLALETMYLATKGYWPKTIDPISGETSPAVEMVAPVKTSYTLYCQKDHELRTVPLAGLIDTTYCNACGRQIPKVELKVSEAIERAKGFELVGGVAFDGLTSMSDLVMEDMDRMRGHSIIGGEKPAFGGVIQSGDLRFGGNNRADYGFSQGRCRQFVNNALSIPFLVEGPIFTALSAEVEESNVSVVGPKFAGSAMTDVASQWFGNVMETAKVPNEKGIEAHTLYLRPFVDAQSRRHLLKTSSSPLATGGVPASLVDPPEAPFSEFNLGKVFRLLDADLARKLKEAGEAVLVEAPTSYGEAVTITPAQQFTSAAAVQAASTPMPTTTTAPAPAPAQTAVAPAPAPAPKVAPPAPPPPPAATVAAPAPIPAPIAAAPAPRVEQPPVVIEPPARGGGTPPPPGMKPPARAPGS